jgi:uncharacterized membrane protein
MNVTKQRSFIKAISWRIIGTADTFVLSYFITHKAITAASIAGFEVLTKTVLYYFHERGWNKISWGRTNDTANK